MENLDLTGTGFGITALILFVFASFFKLNAL
jgi:hypothetical protein